MGIWNGEGMGREWGREGQFTSNLGQDRTTQKEGFQVSKRRTRRGYQQGVISMGLCLHLILLICVYVSYHCMNATNK
jgi:hypothetical protein